MHAAIAKVHEIDSEKRTGKAGLAICTTRLKVQKLRRAREKENEEDPSASAWKKKKK